ncbi:MAG TPA: gliding motility protein GldC [Bacteroidia bacterium]|nr:gliding motility protein GldC [Bacteroidia bacterium]HNT79897.1 gliding motility protein GldC [Bacteroidia bacterium]
MNKTSDINIRVTLNESKHPEKIQWHADDSGVEGLHESKAMILSLWDDKAASSMRIDLWTGDMMVADMQRFFYETLSTLADTYKNATNDESLSNELKKTANLFAQSNPQEIK